MTLPIDLVGKSAELFRNIFELLLLYSCVELRPAQTELLPAHSSVELLHNQVQ